VDRNPIPNEQPNELTIEETYRIHPFLLQAVAMNGQKEVGSRGGVYRFGRVARSGCWRWRLWRRRCRRPDRTNEYSCDSQSDENRRENQDGNGDNDEDDLGPPRQRRTRARGGFRTAPAGTSPRRPTAARRTRAGSPSRTATRPSWLRWDAPLGDFVKHRRRWISSLASQQGRRRWAAYGSGLPFSDRSETGSCAVGLAPPMPPGGLVVSIAVALLLLVCNY
jgi:hypothetical protein